MIRDGRDTLIEPLAHQEGVRKTYRICADDDTLGGPAYSDTVSGLKKNDSCGSSRMVRAASATVLSTSCRCMVRSALPTVSSPEGPWWSSPKVRRPPTRSGGAAIPAVGTVTGAAGMPLRRSRARYARPASTSRCGQMQRPAGPQGARRRHARFIGLLRTREGTGRGPLRGRYLRPSGSQRRATDADDWCPTEAIDDLYDALLALRASSRMPPSEPVPRAGRDPRLPAQTRIDDQGWKERWTACSPPCGIWPSTSATTNALPGWSSLTPPMTSPSGPTATT